MRAPWRTAQPVLALLLAVAVGGACTPRYIKILNAVAERPGGVHLQFTATDALAMSALGVDAPVAFWAELLAVQEDGLLIHLDEGSAHVPAFAPSTVGLVTFDALGSMAVHLLDDRSQQPTQGPRLDLAQPGDMDLLRKWARYPGPVEPRVVAGILEAYGAPEVVRIGRAPDPSPTDGSPHRHTLSEPDPGATDFVKQVEASAIRFQDRSLAIREGYRRLGPDFPGMGEHWIHLSRAAAGKVDPDRPPVLTYVVVGGRPVLTGVAFVAPLAPDEAPPPTPFGPAVWHDHSESVDEEALLLHSPGTGQESAAAQGRVAMFHVWCWAENPDGLLAQNNWALPYMRAGLPVPDRHDPAAARGLSLAGSGTGYYEALFTRATGARGSDREHVLETVRSMAGRVEALLDRASADGEPPLPGELAAVWEALWQALEDGLSDGARDRLALVARDWRH